MFTVKQHLLSMQESVIIYPNLCALCIKEICTSEHRSYSSNQAAVPPKFTAAGRIYPSGIPTRCATRHPISTFTLAEQSTLGRVQAICLNCLAAPPEFRPLLVATWLVRDAHVIGPAALSRVPPGRVQGTEGYIACRIQHVPRVPAMYSFALVHCHVSIVEFARAKINCLNSSRSCLPTRYTTSSLSDQIVRSGCVFPQRIIPSQKTQAPVRNVQW